MPNSEFSPLDVRKSTRSVGPELPPKTVYPEVGALSAYLSQSLARSSPHSLPKGRKRTRYSTPGRRVSPSSRDAPFHLGLSSVPAFCPRARMAVIVTGDTATSVPVVGLRSTFQYAAARESRVIGDARVTSTRSGWVFRAPIVMGFSRRIGRAA